MKSQDRGGLYIYEEDKVTRQQYKKRLPRLAHQISQANIAMLVPMNRQGRGNKPLTRTETLSIPLKRAEITSIEGLRKQSAILAEPVPGSLFEFVSAVLLSGFHIYEKAAPAIAEHYRELHKDVVSKLEYAFDELGIPGGYPATLALLTNYVPRVNAEWTRESMVAQLGKIQLGSSNEAFNADFADAILENVSNSEKPFHEREVLADALVSTLKQHAGATLTGTQLMQACTTAELPNPKLMKCFKTRTIAWKAEGHSEVVRAERWFVHQAIAVAASRVNGEEHKAADVLTKLVSNKQYNGLSWLLGGGLDLFGKFTAEEVSDALNAPKEVVTPLCKMASRLVADIDRSWGDASDYRNHVGASLDSFMMMYWARLEELEAYAEGLTPVLEKVLPEALFQSKAERLFLGTAPASEVKARWNALPETIVALKNHIAQAKGFAETPTAADFEAIEAAIADIYDLGALLNKVRNNGRQALRDAEVSKDPVIKADLEALAEMTQWDDVITSALDDKGAGSKEDEGAVVVGKRSLFKPPKINEFGRTRTPSEVAYANQMALLPKALAWLDEYAPCDDVESIAEDLIAAHKDNEIRHHDMRGKELDLNAAELMARRKTFDEWFAFWRNLSEDARVYAFTIMKDLQGQLASSREKLSWSTLCNSFVFARKGVFYKNLYARSKHREYAMNHQGLAVFDLGGLVAQMYSWAEARQNDSKVAFNDFIEVRGKLATWYAKGMAGTFEARQVDPRLTAPEGLEISLTGREMFALKADRVDAETYQRIMNRVIVAVREVATLTTKQAFDEVFSLKPLSKLKPLVYVPRLRTSDGKARRWTPPGHLRFGHSLAAATLQACWDDVADGDSVAMPDLFGLCLNHLTSPGYKALLAEMPHTWGWACSLPGLSIQEGMLDCAAAESLSVEKDKVSKNRQLKVFAFDAPRRWLNLMDRVLKAEAKNAPGQVKVEASWVPEQGWQDARVFLQLPMATEIPQESGQGDFLNNLIGIDLGERGIGFSVRAIADGVEGEPIAKGFVPIPAIKKLIQATSDYRKKHVKKAKNGRSPHVNFSRMRESVTGHVRSAINHLMYYYRGLPVLEAELGNLESGRQALSHVYNAVISSYTFSGVSMQDSKREHIWRGKHFTHPDYQLVTKRNNKEVVKDLNFFPATVVNAAGTSQTCACCGVNATKLVRDSGKTRFGINQKGQVEIDGQCIQLLKISGLKVGTRVPYEAGDIKSADLIKQIASQRRLAPPNGGKDTTQSRFLCPMTECDQHEFLVHADTNAADNIVKRKLQRIQPKAA
ncbi:type V CRISPR-associated protein Cas12c [Neptuniibacter sp. QD37_11]|uniref:type V CRISPR-associated protein Cas12c n=1 Tax=Neptuniibacter sp. QD37_11 TaxID=3398209 RepID=UPI0039F608B1